MDMEVNKGNFEFVRGMYEDVCKSLQEAEKNSRTNYKNAGSALRDALDNLATRLIDEYKLEFETETQNSKPTLDEKIKLLSAHNCFYDDIKCNNYMTVAGSRNKKNSKEWHKFVRWLGNAFSHPNPELYWPNPDYKNILTALKKMYEVLLKEYDRISEKRNLSYKPLSRKFCEDLMPIGDRYILDANEPVDKEVSKCLKEYMTISFDDHGEPDYYSVVRIYNKKDHDLGMLRDKDAFSQARRRSDINFDGSVELNVISKMDNPQSEFYIVEYKFYGEKPELLFDVDLNKMDLTDRKKLCYKIAEILMHFHNLRTPVYIRNLSYDSICIRYNENGTLIPSIIKLDYAKIDSKRTRYYELKDNVKIRIASRDKYWDSQVDSMIDTSKMMSINWEKADIYSLGVLFGDILYGSTKTTDLVPGWQLKNLNSNLEGYAEITDKMISPDPDKRPSAREVVEMLKGEQKNGIGI